MTTIFGASGTSTTIPGINVLRQSPKLEQDIADSCSGQVQMLRMVKAGFYGVVLQLIFVPFISLFLNYPAEWLNGIGTSGSVTDSVASVFKTVNFTNPLYAVIAVLKIFSGYLSLSVLSIIFVVFASTMTLGFNADVLKLRPRNKAQWLKQWFTPWLWSCSILTGIWTVFLSRLYISIANWEYANISYACDDKSSRAMCVHEKHLFVSICSFTLGFCTFWDSYIHEKFLVKFPTVQKDSMDVIRLALLDNLMETIDIARRFTPIVFVIYFIEGGVIRQVLSILGYTLEEPELSSFFQFLDIELWIQTAIWPVIALFFIKSAWSLLEFTITESLEVPVEALFSSKDALILGDCMNSENSLMKYLGFYKFKLLTCTNSKLILDFFTLSHPGGHPRIWNGVCQSTLKLCRELEASLKIYCRPLPNKTQSEAYDAVNPRINLYSIGCASNDNKNAPDIKSPGLRQRQQMSNMRDLTNPPSTQQGETPNLARIFLMSPYILMEGIKGVVKRLLDKLYSRIGHLTSLFEKVEPELEIANAIAKYQLIMWGINGVVEIVCVSIEHDKYGVVQRDMSSLLQSIVDLHEALIYYTRNPPPGSNTGSAVRVKKENSHMVQLLAQGCQYALSKIHGRFASYYEILGVPKEYQTKVVVISQLYRKPYLRPQRLLAR